MITLIEKIEGEGFVVRKVELTFGDMDVLRNYLRSRDEYVLLTKELYELMSKEIIDEGPSKRALQALRLAQSGLKNAAIAEKMGISEGTVRNYLSEMYEFLGVANRTGAIAKAIELGILSPLRGKRTFLPGVELSPREIEVLSLIREGLTNSEIARATDLGEGTIRNYTSSIYKKLEVSSRTEAVHKAVELGILEPIDVDWME